MKYQLNQIPLFEELKDSNNILLAGAGGGFDIFSGIPLYFALRKLGKNIIMGNLSFTWLDESTSEVVYPYCYKVQATDTERSGRNYFPEKYLKQWLISQREDPPIYAFPMSGVNQLKNAYKYLIKTHSIDTVILVDGGTDSLMFGDEEGLGTPCEDVCSMAAVYRTGIKKQFLLCLGFGVDHFHGVSHYRFLENVNLIAANGGYLGLFQILKEMDEAQKYLQAIEFVNVRMNKQQSIVSNSIASALEGNYGDYHKTSRTPGSKLWINPLMTIYWCFQLRSVIKEIKYYDYIRDVNSAAEFNSQLYTYRRSLDKVREKKQIPI